MSHSSASEDPIAAWLAGRLPAAAAAALLAQLAPETATFEQFAALVAAVAATARPLPEVAGDVFDCCGTGGSGRPHFNVSTTVAFVLAAGGVRVVKFGNRAATSASGSFDLLERLGVPVECPLERLPGLLEATSLAFLYAPQCYPALKSVAAARRRFGRPTLFNYIGPLLHPLRPARRLVGVSHPRMQAFIAQWLAADSRLQRAIVVRGDDHSDELAPRGASVIYDVTPRRVSKYPWVSAEVAAAAGAPDYAPETNVELFWRIVTSADAASLAYHGVRLNAGLGFVAAGRAATVAEGAALAAELLASGRVKRQVEAFLACVRAS
ncbi:MAG: anthranilate phosphoribosyltransferase [Chloracidobacterium sp. CP2_5A]|nr:MAG: anthranilate phosphoribosyltransferase [Chloracidobacterium sp. CP2_5A]